MSDTDANKASGGGKKIAPKIPQCHSPKMNRVPKKATMDDAGIKSQAPKEDKKTDSSTPSNASNVDPKTDSRNPSQPTKPDAKKEESSKHNSGASPASQLKGTTNKQEPDQTKTDRKPTEQVDTGKPNDKSPSVLKAQKSDNPECKKASDTQLQPKDLDLGKTITGIMDALGLLGKKSREEAMKEYQKLLEHQKCLEAQLSSEKKAWFANNMLKECDKIESTAFPGPLQKSLKELEQKSPEKVKDALKEYTFRKKLVTTLQKEHSDSSKHRHGGHVTHVDVGKQDANPTEKKDDPHHQVNNGSQKGKEAKQDGGKQTGGSEQTKKAEHQGDPEKFRIIIPEGYQLVKSEEFEKMQYDLMNQRESIEELTSRLSAIASNKLKEGNPNIADLSDKNRPTKLGEQFASLYDDQWSEAFEEICKGDEEEEEEIKSINILLDVVKEAYKFCGTEADNQLQKIAMGMKDAVCLTKMAEQETVVEHKMKQDTDPKSGEEIRSQKPEVAGGQSGQKPGAAGGQSGQKPGAAGGQSEQKPEAAGGQSGQKPGAAGDQSGQKPGAAGGQSGQKPGTAGGQSGQKPGAANDHSRQTPRTAGDLSGQKPGAAGVHSRQKPETVGGQPGQTPGPNSGQSRQKPGAAGGQPGQKSKTVSGQPGQTPGPNSGQSGQTPPATPPDMEKKGEKTADKAKSAMSETWQIALRCARSFRKETALTAVTEIKQLFKDHCVVTMGLGPPAKLPDAMLIYIDRCVELMWLMAVQDPPMEIQWAEKGERSDTNFYKFYNSKGKFVKQCVWPAVFLSANGGIVSKGYIIGMAPPSPKQGGEKNPK